MVNQKVRRLRLKLENIDQLKKNWRSHFFSKSQQYINPLEIEEEWMECSFRFKSVFKSDQ